MISFSAIDKGALYSRNELAELWGYRSFHALARGIVTPTGENKIIIFLTRDKQEGAEQYANSLVSGCLKMDGPRDHFGEQRMLNATKHSDDEIHVFYRERHHSDFEYVGRFVLESSTLRTDRPSSFTLREFIKS